MREIALRRLAFRIREPRVPLAPVALGLDPLGPVAGDVAHPRRGAARLVDALGVLAARHLEPVLRAGELHLLDGACGHDLEHHAPAADQVAGTGQHLDGRDPAGEVPGELRVLRPDRVFRPDLRRHRIGHLVAVGVGLDSRRGVDAEVRVHVDEAGRDALAGAVHDRCVGWRIHRRSDRRDASVFHQHRAVRDGRPGGRHDRDVADHEGGRRGDPVRGREGIGIRPGFRALAGRRLRLVFLLLRVRRARGGCGRNGRCRLHRLRGLEHHGQACRQAEGDERRSEHLGIIREEARDRESRAFPLRWGP